MLVTIGTKRFKNMLSFRFYDIFIMVFFLLKSSCQSKVANIFFWLLVLIETPGLCKKNLILNR